MKKLIILACIVGLMMCALGACEERPFGSIVNINQLSRLREANKLTISAKFITMPNINRQEFIAEEDNIYCPNEVIWIYIDFDNISLKMIDGKRKINVAQYMTLFDSSGQELFVQVMARYDGILAADYDIENESYFINYLMIPYEAALGTYKLVFTVNDYLADAQADCELDFVVVVPGSLVQSVN